MLTLAIIALCGVFAGAINTIAGGGSLIAIPALIFAGLPANVANATNRVGVIFQSSVATAAFARADKLDTRATLTLLVPTSIGAIAGAMLAVDIDEQLFRRVIGAAMLLMLVTILLKPRRWLQGKDATDQASDQAGDRADDQADGPASSPAWRAGRFLGFLAVGFYGGFLQAGVGVFLLAALVILAGMDLVRANAAKVLLVALFTVPALGIYLYYDLVAWAPGLSLAAGSSIGAWLGAKMTVSWGPTFVRWVLVAVIVTSASRLLGLW